VKGIITKIKDNLTKMEEKFPKMGGDVKKIMEDNLTKSEDVLKILIEKNIRNIEGNITKMEGAKFGQLVDAHISHILETEAKIQELLKASKTQRDEARTRHGGL
jgi:hypothetical protein